MTAANDNNPFVGLRPFESDDSYLFFGRHKQMIELLQRLYQYHLVVITGSSGSGKSSLVRAGLIPQLRAGGLANNQDRWAISIMRPGSAPLQNLAVAISDALSASALTGNASSLMKGIEEEGSVAIVESIRPLWENNRYNYCLLVDQFEELFYFTADGTRFEADDDAIQFVNIVLDLVAQKTLPVYVIITMRSDFIGECAQFYNLSEVLNQCLYLVPRLSRLELKSAIENPVKLFNGQITAGLVNRLLNEVQINKYNQLPLLQHALMRMWNRQPEKNTTVVLDLEGYEAIGGIERALSYHADEALMGSPSEDINSVKRLFQAVTRVDDHGRKVRNPTLLSDLEAITNTSKDKLLTLIAHFNLEDRYFIVMSKQAGGEDAIIDLPHESLIRQWETLNQWVDEEVAASRVFLRLADAAQLYKQGKADLLWGSELQHIGDWYKSFQPTAAWCRRYAVDYEDSIQYLQKSLAAKRNIERRAKIKRISVLSSFVLLVVILVLIIVKLKAVAK